MVRLLLLLTVGCFAFSDVSFACECLGVERPCKQMRYDVVFVGRVTDTVLVKRPADKNSYTLGYSMNFSVEESLRGQVGSDTTIQTGYGNGDCGTPLPVGQRFLIFAYREKDGKLWTGMCSGNQLLSGTAADDKLLDTYRALARKRTGTVFGRVTLSKPVWWQDEVRDGSTKPLQNIILHATNGSFSTETKTSKDGSYEFTGLPNGTYTVAPQIDSSLDFDHEYEERYQANVSDGACANITFKLEPTTRIRGQLKLPRGLQLKNIEVDAIPVHLKKLDESSGQWDLTDENNRFDIWPLPDGDYYVGVNINSSPKADAPFPPTYYPGVTTRKSARVVRVRRGEIKQLELVLSEVAKLRTVHFVAVGLDGKPLRKIYIQMEDLRHPGAAASYVNVDLDEKGAGALTIYSGYSYHLHGSHYVSFQNDWCSEPVVIPAGTQPVEARFVMDRKAANCDIRGIDHTTR